MSSLKEKLDIERDHLMIKFNRGEQRYMAYLPDGAPIFNLTEESSIMLEKKNKELLLNPSLLNKEMQLSTNASRYEELKRIGFPCNSFEVLYHDRDTSVISSDLLDYLRRLTSEENVLIGIHRTGNASLEDIESILTYGLIMETLNGSTTSSSIHLSNNVSYYPNNETIIKELINADSYKGSFGSILIRIPDEELSRNIFMIDTESGNVILDPHYIVGFVPVGPNGHISEIITPYPTSSDAFFKGLDFLYEEREYARNANLSSGTQK